ncbi:MAG: hypothetical protein GY875_11235 [Gammaproteobacteria bacterium]|nr:hypothetical protein [Gammaproteobacteria bacterium]
MEYVIISFPGSRDVYVDGERTGRSGDVIQIEAGIHRFDLGSPRGYEPEFQEVMVSDTSAINPIKIVFSDPQMETSDPASVRKQATKQAVGSKPAAVKNRATKKKAASKTAQKKKTATETAQQQRPGPTFASNKDFAELQRQLSTAAANTLLLAGHYAHVRSPGSAVNSADLIFALVDYMVEPKDHVQVIFRDLVIDIADRPYHAARKKYYDGQIEVPLIPGAIESTDQFAIGSGAGAIIDKAIALAEKWLIQPQRPGPEHLIAALLRVTTPSVRLQLFGMGLPVEQLVELYRERLISQFSSRQSEWQELFPPQDLDEQELARDDSELPVLEPVHYIPTVSSDKTDRGDQLRIQRYVDAFARVIASRNLTPPLSIGLFGDWGSGKTFFMDSLEEQIHELENEGGVPGEEPLYWSKICHVRFNAWHFAEVNLWASLVSTIFEKLRQFIDPDETDEDRFNRLLQELEVAGALKAEAQEKVDQAGKKLKLAEKNRREAGKILKDLAPPPDPDAKEYRALVKRSLSEELSQAFPDSQSLITALLQAGEYLDRQDLKEAADQLSKGKKTVGDARRMLEESRVVATRGGFWWRTLINMHLHEMPYFKAVVIALVIIPVAGYFLTQSSSLNISQGWSNFWTAFAELITIAGALTAWARRQLAGASSVFDRLDGLQARIESSVEQARNRDREKYESDLADARKVEEIARNNVDAALRAEREANERLEDARSELENSTSQERLGRFIRERADAADYTRHLGLIAMVHEDFKRLSKLMAAQQHPQLSRSDLPTVHRIILYIDDLDRCPPHQVVRVLEALHLLLFFPLFVVVVGVDNRWVSRALYKHYPDMLADNSADLTPNGGRQKSAANSQDYLEKIFQVPFWLRDMEIMAVRRLIYSLIDESERDPDFDEANLKDTAGQDGWPSSLEMQEAGGSPDEVVSFTAAPQLIPDQKMEQVVFEAENPVDFIEEEIAPATEALRFSSAELEFMHDVAPLMPRTPRSVKRFVNIYRLYKSGLSTTGLARFLGTDSHPGNFRAVQVLLALSTGSPQLARTVFSEIFDQTETDRKLSNIVELLRDRNILQWRTTLKSLGEFVVTGKNNLALADLRAVAPLVSRYSVHHLAGDSPGETNLG